MFPDKWSIKNVPQKYLYDEHLFCCLNYMLLNKYHYSVVYLAFFLTLSGIFFSLIFLVARLSTSFLTENFICISDSIYPTNMAVTALVLIWSEVPLLALDQKTLTLQLYSFLCACSLLLKSFRIKWSSLKLVIVPCDGHKMPHCAAL